MVNLYASDWKNIAHRMSQAQLKAKVAFTPALKLHHTALNSGYLSRVKNENFAIPYSGIYGRGYKLFKSNSESTRYVIVEYYIYDSEKGVK